MTERSFDMWYKDGRAWYQCAIIGQSDVDKWRANPENKGKEGRTIKFEECSLPGYLVCANYSNKCDKPACTDTHTYELRHDKTQQYSYKIWRDGKLVIDCLTARDAYDRLTALEVPWGQGISLEASLGN